MTVLRSGAVHMAPPFLRLTPTELDTLKEKLRGILTELPKIRESTPRGALQQALAVRRQARRVGLTEQQAWGSYQAGAAAFRLTRGPLSLALTQEAQTLFSQLDDRYGQASVENLIGVLHQEQGDYIQSYQHFHQALFLAREIDHLRLQAIILGNLSFTMQSLGDMRRAMHWNLEALTLARSRDEPAELARLLINSVSLALPLGLVKQAQAYAEEAGQIYARMGTAAVERSVVASRLAMVEVHDHLGQHPQALHLAQQVVAYATTGNRPEMLRDLMQAHRQSGRSLIHLKRLDEAAKELHAALDLARRIRYVEFECSVLTLLGRLKMAQRNWEGARTVLGEAQRLGERADGPERSPILIELVEVYRTQAECEQRAGRAQVALDAYRAYHNLSKRLFGKQQAMIAQTLVIMHEAEKHRLLNTQLENANRELRYTADHDALTGALSRLAFEETVASYLARPYPETASHGVGFVLFDVDRFKHVNDQFGHSVGDKVLRTVVRVTQSLLRPGDLLCRWGGEEFFILLSHITQDDTRTLAERVRRAIETSPWGQFHPDLTVTASFGAGVWLPSAETPTLGLLYPQVDRALYEAKTAGRNRTVMAVLTGPS